MEAELVKLRKEVDDAKRRAEVAERRAEEAQREVRNTTLVEYLEYCHQHLFTTFEVQRDPRLTTAGPASAPHGKLCPTYLRHWDDFDTLQRRTLDSLFTLYPAVQEAFPSLHATRTQGQEMSRGKIGDHLTLDHFVGKFVETPVRSIFARLMKHLGFCRRDAHQRIWVIGPKLGLASRAISHSKGDYSKQFSNTRNNTFKPSIVEPHSPLYSSESLRGSTGENSSDCLSWLKAESAPQIYFAEKPGA